MNKNNYEESLDRLYRCIPIGKENGIRQKDLEGIFSCEARVIRANIRELRERGYFIASSPKDGYYIPETREEALNFMSEFDYNLKRRIELQEKIKKAFTERY